MKYVKLILLLQIFWLQPCFAYLDTTPKGFSKPKPIISSPYKQIETEYEKYADLAAEKIAPQVFSAVVTGPAGTVINVLDKAIDLKEKQDAEKTNQLRKFN